MSRPSLLLRACVRACIIMLCMCVCVCVCCDRRNLLLLRKVGACMYLFPSVSRIAPMKYEMPFSQLSWLCTHVAVLYCNSAVLYVACTVRCCRAYSKYRYAVHHWTKNKLDRNFMLQQSGRAALRSYSMLSAVHPHGAAAHTCDVRFAIS